MTINFDFKTVLQNMLVAASGSLGSSWPAAESFASNEFAKLAQDAV